MQQSHVKTPKKAEELTSARLISAATSIISTSAAEQKQYDNDPAGIAIAASAVITTSIVSTQAHQADDPENTTAGIISEKTVSITAATTAIIVASTSFITTSTVCSS